MDNRNGNGIVAIIAIIAFVIVVIGGLTYYCISLDKTVKRQTTEISKLNSQITDLQTSNKNYESAMNDINKAVDDIKNESEEKPKEKVVSNWNGNIEDIDFSKIRKDICNYETMEAAYFKDFRGVVNNNKIMMYIQGDEEGKAKFDYSLTNLNDLGYIKSSDIPLEGSYTYKKELKVDASEVKAIYVSAFGHDFVKDNPIIVVMNDGSLKYDSAENFSNDKVSLKEVKDLKNIVEMYYSSVGEISDGKRQGGYMTTIAVDKNGIAYDLSDYIK